MHLPIKQKKIHDRMSNLFNNPQPKHCPIRAAQNPFNKNPWAVGVAALSLISAAVYLLAPLFSIPIFGLHRLRLCPRVLLLPTLHGHVHLPHSGHRRFRGNIVRIPQRNRPTHLIGGFCSVAAHVHDIFRGEPLPLSGFYRKRHAENIHDSDDRMGRMARACHSLACVFVGNSARLHRLQTI